MYVRAHILTDRQTGGGNQPTGASCSILMKLRARILTNGQTGVNRPTKAGCTTLVHLGAYLLTDRPERIN